jgi:L,D-peptidoglycan transpeptidase YkuD (ErfK/YbiS/YcfS/YnhG family)
LIGEKVQIFKATASGALSYDGVTCRCALGKEGVIEAREKREGDGKSPLGVWPIRRVMYRADKIDPPKTAFPLTVIGREDGWCDASDDPHYNQFVTHPYPASAERLWRNDDVYDVIVVLGHNDDPIVAGLGSAIFMHVSQPDFRGTEGCVALPLAHLRALLEVAQVGDCVEIARD